MDDNLIDIEVMLVSRGFVRFSLKDVSDEFVQTQCQHEDKDDLMETLEYYYDTISENDMLIAIRYEVPKLGGYPVASAP